jgi:hypothetical protein
MGVVQSDAQTDPTVGHREADVRQAVAHGVAAQVVFERHILKPGLMFKGKGLKPAAFQLWVRGRQRAPPHHGARSRGALPDLHRRLTPVVGAVE